MSFIVAIAALCFLMLAAYRGFSVIIFAPIAALARRAGHRTVRPSCRSTAACSWTRWSCFVKLYFPVFLLGADLRQSDRAVRLLPLDRRRDDPAGRAERAVLAIVIVCALLTYGGVSLFVVVFAVYPFAAEAFRLGDLPKRLIPGTIALGAFTFTMDALPGTPQIQNIIPAAFFKTNAWSAPWLGLIGAIYHRRLSASPT